MTLIISHNTVTLIGTGLYESLKVGGWISPYIGPKSSKNWQMPLYPDGVIHCAWVYPGWLLGGFHLLGSLRRRFVGVAQQGIDFGIWQANYPNNVGGAAMIPDPGTLALLLLGGLSLLRRRR